MNIILIIPIVFLIILLFIFIIFLAFSKRQESTLQTIDNTGNIKKDENKVEKVNDKKVESKKEEYKKEDVFKLMEFDRILDGMIVQNGGSRFTMAIRCKGINYDLMSEMEQLSVEEGFITFLNTLKFPIQLYVQAQNIDLKGNISKYRENITDLTNDYNEITEKYNKLASSFDADEIQLDRITKERDKIGNVYEYANDIIKYVEKMSTNKSLLQRKFFILISYSTSEINAIEKFNKDEIIEMCSTELMTRCRGVISALSSCSVSGNILDSNELADLLYSAYNRDDKSLMSVKEAIEGGMLRLYSTSEDAFEKKEEEVENYLRTQAQLTAYKAIKYAKEHNEIETPAEEVLEQEEEIARRATMYVKSSDYSQEEKDIATKKILNDYRDNKKELNEISKVQRETIEKQIEEDVSKIPELEKQKAPYGIGLIQKSQEYSKVQEYAEKNNDEEVANNDKNKKENQVEKTNEDKDLDYQELYTSSEDSNNNDDDENESIV